MEREESILKKRTVRKIKSKIPLNGRELYEVTNLFKIISNTIITNYKIITKTIQKAVKAASVFSKFEKAMFESRKHK